MCGLTMTSICKSVLYSLMTSFKVNHWFAHVGAVAYAYAYLLTLELKKKEHINIEADIKRT